MAWPCCCGGSCDEGCGAYAVSTSVVCTTGGGGSTGLETGDFRCAADGGCGATWLDTFTETVCGSSRSIYVKVYLCCEAIYVVIEAETGAISSDLYYWKLTKSEGDYPGCSISGLNIPFFSQSGPFPPGIGCSASSSTCTLTASC
jgi:hypothetical protein